MKTNLLLLTLLLTLQSGLLISQNCTVNAGIEQSNCVSNPTELKGNATGLFSKNPHWELVTGPSLHIMSPDSFTTTINGYTGKNSYTFRIAATCEDGTKVEDQVNIQISALPQTPDANADQTQCTINGLSVNLSASALQSNETGFWEILAGGAGTFSDSLSPKSKFTLAGDNCIGSAEMILRWTVTNGTCISFDDVTITYIGGAPVDAGKHQSVSCATKIKLAASCPGKVQQAGTWTLISGPGGGTFADAKAYNSLLSNLQIGTYLLKWSVSGPCVTNEDTVSITILTLGIATNVSVSSNQSYCDQNLPSSFTISGTPADSGLTGWWAQTSGTTTTIIGTNSASTTIDGIKTAGDYSYKWTLSDGLCVTTAIVTISVVSKLSADAGPDMIAKCGARTATMIPGSKVGVWAFVSGPAKPTIKGNVVSKLVQQGVYVMKYSSSNACGKETDTATITVSSPPSNAKAGTDQIFACSVVAGTLAANKPSNGTGTWSQISGPNTAIFSDIHNPSSNLTGLIGGNYNMKWEISSGGGCTAASDEVTIYISTKAPTSSDAGIDQTIRKSDPLKLNGSSPSLQEVGTWSQIGGATVTIDNPNAKNCTVTGIEENSIYTFVWNISNACGFSSDTVIIKVMPDSKVGGDTSYCNASTIKITGGAHGASIGVWSQVNGPTCTITNTKTQTTYVKNMLPGVYQFDWASTMGGQVSHDTITITNLAPVYAHAGLNQDIVNTTTATLHGSVIQKSTGTWSVISGLGVNIVSPSSPISLVTGLSKGVYKFRWTVSNGVCNEYSDVRISVLGLVPVDSQALALNNDPKIYVPNAFTPNNDGLNDKFKPTTSGNSKYTMALFNRWGQQVYIGSETDEGWDGTYRNMDCQSEVYLYQIVYENIKSTTFSTGETLRGTVTLLR